MARATVERQRTVRRDDVRRDDVRRDGEDVRTEMRVPAAAPSVREESAPLFSMEEGRQLRSRWELIQTGFVDEPRRSVEQADALVAQVMKRLAEVFSEERSQLESQWARGDDVSTEDLRIALRRYRSFFDRLLAV